GILVLFTTLVLLRGLPAVDPTANALRPRNSLAYAALDEVKKELNKGREPLWLLVGGKTETEVARRLEAVQNALERASSNELIGQFTLPIPLWPRPEFQQLNRAAAEHLVSEGPMLKQAALTNGFTESALALTDQILSGWEQATQTRGVFWP